MLAIAGCKIHMFYMYIHVYESPKNLRLLRGLQSILLKLPEAVIVKKNLPKETMEI